MTDVCSCSSFVAIFQTNVEKRFLIMYDFKQNAFFSSNQGVSVSERENHTSLQVKSSLSFSFKPVPTFWFNTALKVLYFYKTRMHSSRMRTARSLQYVGFPW